MNITKLVMIYWVAYIHFIGIGKTKKEQVNVIINYI